VISIYSGRFQSTDVLYVSDLRRGVRTFLGETHVLNRRQRTGYLVLAVFIVHIILISAQVTARPGASVLEAFTFGTLAEAQRLVLSGVHGMRSLWSGYISLQSVREENVALRETVAQLELSLQQRNALAQRAHSLQQLHMHCKISFHFLLVYQVNKRKKYFKY